MHSVKREKPTTDQQQAHKRRDAVEIAKFQKLDKLVLARDPEVPLETAISQCSELLQMDWDHYTGWNIRREIISRASKEEQPAILKNELKFTESLLPKAPKSYWVWNHRKWVLERIGLDDVWDREMALVGKLLERDPRNFHGWGYRYWLIQQMGAHNDQAAARDEDMFQFTTKKINQNYSNFSAWHYRAQMIPKLAKQPSLKSELDYVYEVVAMDPQDQSGWLYFQWLVKNPQVFHSELSKSQLEEIHGLVKDIWDEERTLSAARFLITLEGLMSQPVDTKLVNAMTELDPLRAQRYSSLVK